MNDKIDSLMRHFGEVVESTTSHIDQVRRAYDNSHYDDPMIDGWFFNLEILSSEIKSLYAEFQDTKDTNVGDELVSHFEKVGNVAHSIIMRIDDLTRA